MIEEGVIYFFKTINYPLITGFKITKFIESTDFIPCII